jgi:alpha-beta hydrolase superfamily lysophospholipase
MASSQRTHHHRSRILFPLKDFYRYNSIASTVISTVKSELAAHPGYTLVTSGHSLGGALSSLTAMSLKGNFPSA